MSVFEALKDLLFPACCLACGAALHQYRLPLLCQSCCSALSPVVPPLCTCCGLPFPSGEDHLCGNCLSGAMPFDLARAPFLYQEPISSLITQWKFGQKVTGLETLAALTADSAVFSHFSTPDFIIPVPLHIIRLQKRGFNQALMLSRCCFPEWRNKILVDGLQRIRSTIPQTGLSGLTRRKNLKGAFEVRSPNVVEGKNVLLIDDVLTTGSTISECSKVLRRAGVRRVEVFTLARAL